MIPLFLHEHGQRVMAAQPHIYIQLKCVCLQAGRTDWYLPEMIWEAVCPLRPIRMEEAVRMPSSRLSIQPMCSTGRFIMAVQEVTLEKELPSTRETIFFFRERLKVQAV